jgi:uncharacterized protein (TIGR03437 family)
LSRSLPTSLLNISVQVKDIAGVEMTAPLFFVSPGQINYLVPPALAPGLATVTVLNGSQSFAVGTLLLQTVAPGFFTANQDGAGVVSADVIRVNSTTQAQTLTFTFQCGSTPRSCTPLPIDLSGPDSFYLLLFGTGIRNRTSLSAVTATVGGVSVPVLFAGPQSEYPGLDQINIGPLPKSFIGKGEAEISVKVDGLGTNKVSVAFR